jgi:SNF2 family DNA or RNA helicase
MKIRKEKNNLKIEFEYDPILVQKIRRIPNRKFNAKKKVWTVPIANIKEVVDTLTPDGFQLSYDVAKLYDEKIKEKKKIRRVLANKLKESEKKLLKETNLPFFNFQKKGVAFLTIIKSGLLGDEPGLGKTIQSIGTLSITNSFPALIICPNTLKFQWYEEIKKWLPGKSCIIIGGTKKQREEKWKENADFCIMNYELLNRDLKYIKEKKWESIISDESTRISNPRTQQSKNIKKIKANRRIAMTGTPLNNTVNDLWNIIDFCQPGSLGSYWQFTEQYCIKDRWGSVTGYKNLPELKEKLYSLMIRRKKEEVLDDLPDKLCETIYLEFDKEEQQIYDAIKDEIIEELKEYELDTILNDKFLSNAVVKMVRLRQASCSFELVSKHTHSVKVDALNELLTDILHESSKVIIFTTFKKMANILNNKLKKYNPLLFTGETEQEDRNKIVKLFNTNDKYKMLVMTDAGAHGLNLQSANYIIHYDLPWSLSKVEQREGRAHRIGQKNKLTIFKLIVKNTIDEYVLKVLHNKQKTSDDLLEREKVRKIKLSKHDVKKILNIY